MILNSEQLHRSIKFSLAHAHDVSRSSKHSNCKMKSSDLIALSIALFSGPAFAQGYTNQSEVPFYGQSPPVYPSRES